MHISTQNKACPESTFLCEKVSYSIPAINVRVLSHAQFFATPLTVAHQVPCPRDSPCENTGVGCHFHLQGIFLTQELNTNLLHCRQTLYHLSHQGSLEQQTGSKSEKEYVKAVYCHPADLTSMQSTSWETLGWKKHKLNQDSWEKYQ